MGKVIRAYRSHPYHRRTLPQGVVASWAGITQAQLSRIESRQPERHLDRLIAWARLLDIPNHLLWFSLPSQRTRAPSPSMADGIASAAYAGQEATRGAQTATDRAPSHGTGAGVATVAHGGASPPSAPSVDQLVRIASAASLGAIATELGLPLSAISHLQHPVAPERSFFASGPVTVAVPMRAMPDRPLPVISWEDTRAAERMTGLLVRLGVQVHQFRIPTSGNWEPPGDTVAICGPKSSHMTAEAIESDPLLTFRADHRGRWVIRERGTGTVYESPMDDPSTPRWADLAYIGRLVLHGRPVLIVAGIHALGSVGAVDYLALHLADLYARFGRRRFSMVVGSEHDGDTVTRSELVCPPRMHE